MGVISILSLEWVERTEMMIGAGLTKQEERKAAKRFHSAYESEHLGDSSLLTHTE